MRCAGCLSKDGCNEYHRLCVTWDRVSRNFFTGSVLTGVSSQFELAIADLRKYQAVVEEIRGAAILIDLALDDLPPGHPHKKNPRYIREMLDKDVNNEDSHLSRLEELLAEHREYQQRLTEVEDELFQFDEGGTSTEVNTPGETAETSSPPTLTGTATAWQLQATFQHVNIPTGFVENEELQRFVIDPGPKDKTTPEDKTDLESHHGETGKNTTEAGQGADKGRRRSQSESRPRHLQIKKLPAHG